MIELTFYSGGPVVTDHLLGTARKASAPTQVKCMSVQRPLLLIASLLAVGLIGFALLFRRHLLSEEIAILIVASVLGAVIERLRQVRSGIERAMTFRNHEEPRP